MSNVPTPPQKPEQGMDENKNLIELVSQNPGLKFVDGSEDYGDKAYSTTVYVYQIEGFSNRFILISVCKGFSDKITMSTSLDNSCKWIENYFQGDKHKGEFYTMITDISAVPDPLKNVPVREMFNIIVRINKIKNIIDAATIAPGEKGSILIELLKKLAKGSLRLFLHLNNEEFKSTQPALNYAISSFNKIKE
jgi:hypothetical protein